MSRLSLLSQSTANDLVVNIGDTANDRTGDPLRDAFNKIKSSLNRAETNFIELYNTAAADVQIPSQTTHGGKVLTTNGTTLSWATVETGQWRFNGDTAYNNTGNGLYIQPSQGTNDGSIYLPYEEEGGDIVISNNSGGSGAVTVSTNNKTWVFDANGDLSLPNNSTNGSSFQASTTTGVNGVTKEFTGGSAVDTVTTTWTATGGGIVGTATITNVTVGLSFTFVTFNQSFTATGPITFSSGVANVSGAICQRNTRTVNKGYTTVTANDSGVIFSGSDWQTGFKLIIMVETRLDGNVDNVDHTQMCEALIAANYNSNTEPAMSVYGLTYTSPNPLATFEVQRTGNSIEVVATNIQTEYDLHVSVHAIQFGSYYD